MSGTGFSALVFSTRQNAPHSAGAAGGSGFPLVRPVVRPEIGPQTRGGSVTAPHFCERRPQYRGGRRFWVSTCTTGRTSGELARPAAPALRAGLPPRGPRARARRQARRWPACSGRLDPEGIRQRRHAEWMRTCGWPTGPRCGISTHGLWLRAFTRQEAAPRPSRCPKCDAPEHKP
jgi:hypothetical protein